MTYNKVTKWYLTLFDRSIRESANGETKFKFLLVCILPVWNNSTVWGCRVGSHLHARHLCFPAVIIAWYVYRRAHFRIIERFVEFLEELSGGWAWVITLDFRFYNVLNFLNNFGLQRRCRLHPTWLQYGFFLTCSSRLALTTPFNSSWGALRSAVAWCPEIGSHINHIFCGLWPTPERRPAETNCPTLDRKSVILANWF